MSTGSLEGLCGGLCRRLSFLQLQQHIQVLPVVRARHQHWQEKAHIGTLPLLAMRMSALRTGGDMHDVPQLQEVSLTKLNRCSTHISLHRSGYSALSARVTHSAATCHLNQYQQLDIPGAARSVSMLDAGIVNQISQPIRLCMLECRLE